MEKIIEIVEAVEMWEKATQKREQANLERENEFAEMMECFQESVLDSANCGGYHIYIEVGKNLWNFFNINIDRVVETFEEAGYIVVWQPSPKAKNKLGELYICWGEEE